MGTTRTIPATKWMNSLVDAILDSEDGDKIIVSTEVQRELAKRAMKGICPDKHIVLTVKAPDRTS